MKLPSMGLFSSRADFASAATDQGHALLEAICGFVRRFVLLSETQLWVIATWVVHTHALIAAETTPYLAITSAEKQSGKTRLLETLELLVNNPWFTGRVTAASLVRKIDAQKPTLLLDESDAAFNGDQEYAETLRGVLNTGHRRGGRASLCIGQGTSTAVKDFDTFCAKAIAGIGRLPDTVADRSIPIRLKRKAPGESVERFRRRETSVDSKEIRRGIAAWVPQVLKSLSAARPGLPDALTDRQQDSVEPLLAIADSAGPLWGERLRKALIDIFSGQSGEDQSLGVRLLLDIRAVFDSTHSDKVATQDLLCRLTEIETSPWAEWNHGKSLTPVGLARLLKKFEISPRTIRVDSTTPKGYLRDSFLDAWQRYLPRHEISVALDLGTGPQPPPQAAIYADKAQNFEPQPPITVAWSEIGETRIKRPLVVDVAAQSANQAPQPQAKPEPRIIKGDL